MAAPTTPDFANTPLEGIDFATTYTVADTTTAPEYPGPPFKLGTHALGSEQSEYVFCKASAAVAKYEAVSINTTFSVASLTLAAVRQLTEYGFAQVAIASGDYGWVCKRGQGIGVLARIGSLANVPVYISSVSPGRVTTTSVRNTSGGTLVNVVLTTSATSGTTGVALNGIATVANAVWPGTSRAAG